MSLETKRKKIPKKRGTLLKVCEVCTKSKRISRYGKVCSVCVAAGYSKTDTKKNRQIVAELKRSHKMIYEEILDFITW